MPLCFVGSNSTPNSAGGFRLAPNRLGLFHTTVLTRHTSQMTSPSLGNPPRLPSSVSSALDISQSSVRRRVSGPHSNPSLCVTPSGETTKSPGKERYANPFDETRSIPQRRLPSLGRELFSEDEDVKPSAPHPLEPPRLDSRPLPSLPTDTPGLSGPPGESITRLPTPNFAAVHDDIQHMHDVDTRLGLFVKLTQPFRMKGESKSGSCVGSKTTDSRPGTSTLSRRDTTGTEGTFVTAASRPSNTDTGVGPLSRRTTKSTRFLDVPEDTNDDLISEDGSNEGLLNAQTPRSPALLAATYAATDRFTRRFPISLPHRKANSGREDLDDQNLLPLLGYGETGAVVESPSVWTPEKWALLVSVCSVFVYGLTGLMLVLMTWFGVWPNSAIMRIVDYDILVTITSASLIVFGTSLFGICGTLLNNRPLLACYCVLLWPSFAAMLVIGYTAYRRAAFALPSKLDQAWSQKYGDGDRMILQYTLRCCGYWSPEHSASASPMCYPRSPLPGCKARLIHFERASLARYYTWTFSLVPLHILNIFTALLCANHVNRLFGKGLTPSKYRLSIQDVRANALHVLETYRDTLIPPEPGRVYALRSRQLGDGTRRSPMIPQGEVDTSPRQRQVASIQPVRDGGDEWTMAHTESDGSMFGFRKRGV